MYGCVCTDRKKIHIVCICVCRYIICVFECVFGYAYMCVRLCIPTPQDDTNTEAVCLHKFKVSKFTKLMRTFPKYYIFVLSFTPTCVCKVGQGLQRFSPQPSHPHPLHCLTFATHSVINVIAHSRSHYFIPEFTHPLTLSLLLTLSHLSFHSLLVVHSLLPSLIYFPLSVPHTHSLTHSVLPSPPFSLSPSFPSLIRPLYYLLVHCFPSVFLSIVSVRSS